MSTTDNLDAQANSLAANVPLCATSPASNSPSLGAKHDMRISSVSGTGHTDGVLDSPPPSAIHASAAHCWKKRKANCSELHPSVSCGPATSQPDDDEFVRRLHHFPKRDIYMPIPQLEFDFRIAVKLDSKVTRPPNSSKELITTTSGKWSGSFGKGCVLAGGYDLAQARGLRPIRILEASFILLTADTTPATFEVRTRGALSGASHVLDTLLSPLGGRNVDPRAYSFRMFCTLTTQDHRYIEHLNAGLWVASGIWKEDDMIIDAFRVM